MPHHALRHLQDVVETDAESDVVDYLLRRRQLSSVGVRGLAPSVRWVSTLFAYFRLIWSSSASTVRLLKSSGSMTTRSEKEVCGRCKFLPQKYDRPGMTHEDKH